MVNEDGLHVDLSWPMVQRRCRALGIKHVPLICYCSAKDIIDRVDMALKSGSAIGNNPKEGVVVRIDDKHGASFLKHKSFEFKLMEGIIKDNSKYVDAEEAAS